jgi:negative regulator of PHO system
MRDGSFAEMISGVPLFRGRDNNDQLNAIIKVIGTPDDRTFRKIMQDSVRYLPHPLSSPLTTPPPQPEVQFRQLPKYPKQNFQTLLPRASPLAINLLEGLQHPYFREQQYTQLTNEQMQQAALVQQQQAQHQQAQAAQQQRLQQAQAAQAQAAAHQQGYAYSEFPDYSPRSCVDPFDRSKYLTATDGANAAIPGTSSTAGPRHAYD